MRVFLCVLVYVMSTTSFANQHYKHHKHCGHHPRYLDVGKRNCHMVDSKHWVCEGKKKPL